MRRILLVLGAMLVAGLAQAQIVWVGAGAGTVWSHSSDSAAGETLVHNKDMAPMLVVAFPLIDEAAFRLRAQTLPVDTAYNGEAWPGKVRAITFGVDYYFADVVGQAVLSGGVGRYQLDLQAKRPPAGLEDAKFGWYLGVGQWFVMTRRSRLSFEVTMDRCTVPGDPMLLTATGALLFSF
jgi:hypothetical protein